MARLQNGYLADNPLTVELIIGAPNEEGWRKLRLILFSDLLPQRVIASCTGELGYDFDVLLDELEKLSDGNAPTVTFEADDAPFSLRGSRLVTGEIEMVWIIDIGETQNRVGTGTGIGILLITETGPLRDFIEDLRHGASYSDFRVG